MRGISIKRLNDTVQALYETGLHAYALSRGGELISRGSIKPYRGDRHILFSLTKSFTSAAIGFLMREGKIDARDKVVSFFPEAFDGRPCQNMEKMCVKDLLMMATGHVKEPDIFPADATALESFLTSYVPKTPGGHFMYNTAGSCILAYIAEKVSGQRLDAYLKPRLFKPLGIQDYRWQKLKDGVCTGGFGLSADTDALLKFGRLLLQKGVWEGQRLLDESWVLDATSAQIIQQDGQGDWGAGYGYQFWRNTRMNSYRGDGAFGQYMIVLPEQDVVWASHSGTNDMPKQLDILFDMLFAYIDKDADERGEVTLPAYPPLSDGLSSGAAGRVSGVSFRFENASEWFPIESMRFVFKENTALTLTYDGVPLTYAIGRGEHLCTVIDEERVKRDAERMCYVQASGAWESEDLFHARLMHVNTPFVTDIRAYFKNDAVKAEVTFNVGFGPTAFTLNGIRE